MLNIEMTTKREKICGIYKITNLVNQKIYVGRSYDIFKRWMSHRSTKNRLLSAAFRKYTAERFSWEILEIVSDRERLLEVEQKWLDHLQPFGERGYNIAKLAGNTAGIPCRESKKRKISEANKGRSGRKSKRSKPTIFMNPGGELIEFESINRGAQKYGLNVSCMAEVARGERRSYKGWTCPTANWVSKLDHGYDLIGLGGERVRVSILKRFCEERGLSFSAMNQVVSGLSKQHKGWRLATSTWKPKVFIDSDGNRHEVYSLKEFSREMGLNHKSLCSLSCGAILVLQGWKIENTPEGLG
jgi:hypothetical protein